jgi:SAM-dependent methyltransferase
VSRRIDHRRGTPADVEAELLEALEILHGPLSAPKTVERISKGLKKIERASRRERGKSLPRKYLRDPDIALAYSTYAVCSEAPKLTAILNRIGQLPQSDRPLRVLELGCGPGTGVAALGIAARATGVDIHHFATDNMPEMLAMTAELAQALKLDNVMPIKVDLARPVGRQLDDPEPFDLILCMNILNELPTDRLNLLIREFGRWLTTDGHVIVVEPTSTEKNRHLLAFRDRCAHTNWQILAPCPHQEPCPALESDTETCHDSWSFHRPEFMSDVDGKSNGRPDSLNATWFVIAREHRIKISENRGRVLGERVREKGRIHAKVCTENGLATLELQNRDRTDKNADFARIERYDLIEISEPESTGQRLRLTKEGRCETLDETDLLLIDQEDCGGNMP